MQMDYSPLFLDVGSSREKADELSHLVQSSCPWLDGEEEVASSFGVEMLRDELPAEVLAVVSAQALLDWHNGQIMSRWSGPRFDQAYAEFCQIIEVHGGSDPFDEDRFYLIDDSFSSPHVFVISHEGTADEGLKSALRDWLFTWTMYEAVSVVDAQDDPIFTARR